MANVHRAYVIQDDAYYVRVEGNGHIHKFAGPNSDKESYSVMRELVAKEQKKDPRSKMIDHANST